MKEDKKRREKNSCQFVKFVAKNLFVFVFHIKSAIITNRP